MTGRRTLGSGSPWEPVVGYSRAVRVGDRILVSGTTGIGPEGEPADGLEAQTRRAIQIIGEALSALGATLDDVVRTRIFVTDIATWEIVGRVHGEAFARARPVTSMVQVAALIDPRLLVEIEAEAVTSAG